MNAGRSPQAWLARRLQAPPAVQQILQRATRSGGRAWVVGGTVRDALIGRPPHDWDCAVELGGPELVAQFPDAAAADPRLGMVLLRGADGQGDVVLTSMRAEAGYSDHRHPDVVRFGVGVAEDAQRRDFTVNALYFDPLTGELQDPTSGIQDLRLCRLAVIGDPVTRLREDPLRILRAIRFAASCHLELNDELPDAIAQTAPLLTHLSAERIAGELDRMFRGIGRGRALGLLVRSGVASYVLPELVAMEGIPQPPQFHPEGDVLTHVCLVLAQVPAGDRVLAWSAVLHDIGKPATFERAEDRIRFSRHDVVSADMAEQILRRLRIGKDVRERVVEICRDHIRFASLPEMAAPRRERWLRSAGFAHHLRFHRADCEASHGLLGIHEYASRELETLPPLPPPPLCTGRDVLALGVPPGPRVGTLLAAVDEMVAAGEIPDRDTALSKLRSLVESGVKPERRGDR